MSIIKRAYFYRFYPTDEQKHMLARTFGCVRYTYNWALRLSINTYQETGKGLSYKELSAQLTVLKQQEDTAFLNQVSCVPVQQSLRHLKRANVNFFEGRAKYPTFKKRSGSQSAEYTRSAFTWEDGTLTLARMDGPLAIVWSRPLPPGSQPPPSRSVVIRPIAILSRYWSRKRCWSFRKRTSRSASIWDS